MKKLTAFLTFSICFLSFYGWGQPTGSGGQPKLMLPIAHTDYIYSVAFSPDGKKIVTTSMDKTAKIWDAETQVLLINLIGHQGFVVDAAFSPDGKKIVTSSWDNTAKIWDVSTGALLFDLEGHTDGVSGASFSPACPDDPIGGKKVVTSSWDHSAKIWDSQTGKLLADLKGHTAEIMKAIFSPDGKKVVTSSWDNTAKIWDAQTGVLVANLKGHTQKVVRAVFSPDSKMIATASYDNTAKLWNARTGSLMADLKGHTGKISLVAFSPACPDDPIGGKYILTASYDSTAKLWDSRNGSLVTDFKGMGSIVEAIYFSPDGKKIITTTTGEKIKIWDARNGLLLADWPMHALMLSYEETFAVSPDGKKIIVAYDKIVEIWDLENRKLVGALKGHIAEAYSAVFSPDGKRILGAIGNTAKIWNAQNGALLSSFDGHRAFVFSVAFSPPCPDDPVGGKMIATGSDDSTARIWDSETGKLLSVLTGHTERVWNVLFSPDGKKLLTLSNDNTPKLWDARTGKLLANLEGHTDFMSAAAFSPDGKKIITASADRTAKLWDVKSGTLLVTIRPHNMYITTTVFSPDNKKFLTASRDSTAKIWDTQTGKLLITLKGHTGDIFSAQFSPAGSNDPSGGKKVVTASFDGTAKIWDAQTGKILMNLKGHTDYVENVIFSQDGKKIITSSSDRTIKIWDAASGRLLTSLVGSKSYFKSTEISQDGKYIVTTAADYTIKKWNAVSGELLYNFFAIDSSDYLVVDKYNHYDGSSGGRKLLYFTCGSEVIALDQVKDQLWVPDLAERINNGETINAKKLEDLNLCGLTPGTEMASSVPGEYRFIITPHRGGLGITVLYVNGIEVKRYTPAQLMKNGEHYELNVKKEEINNYFITGSENPVTIKAYTADNAFASRGFKLTVTESKQITTPPNLYAVMVGISDYKGDELDLKYAAKDATDISSAISAAAKKLLNTDGKEHVFMYNLTTSAGHYQLPEKNSIKTLLAEIGKKATANDILLIFFAGHGVMGGKPAFAEASAGKQFYFLTSDASQASAVDAIADVGISTAELSEWMKPSVIKAQKRVLIFDACNSGQAIRDLVKIGASDQNYIAARNDEKGRQTKAIDKLNEQSGFFILSASASDQSAYEMGRYSQGLLTYSLLKAIKQQPDILEEGKYLDLSKWFNAAQKTVSDISKESGARQQPQLITNTNFNIGIVDDEVMAKIVLPTEKPLFAASIFFNNDEAIGDDDLELSKMVNLQLADISSRGTDSKIVYVTATNSPEVYTLTGRYEVKGNSLTVKVNIKQNKEIKYRFELSGTKDKLNELVAAIAGKAAEVVK